MSTSKKLGTTRYLGVMAYRTTFVHDQGRCSPISMELLQISQQELSGMEGRPRAIAYLVDLPLCQILKVGVVDHDGGRRPSRMFIRAQEGEGRDVHDDNDPKYRFGSSTIDAYVEQCKGIYLRLQIHNRASYISFADVLTMP